MDFSVPRNYILPKEWVPGIFYTLLFTFLCLHLVSLCNVIDESDQASRIWIPQTHGFWIPLFGFRIPSRWILHLMSYLMNILSLQLISKEIRRTERKLYEYAPPPPINTLVTALQIDLFYNCQITYVSK